MCVHRWLATSFLLCAMCVEMSGVQLECCLKACIILIWAGLSLYMWSRVCSEVVVTREQSGCMFNWQVEWVCHGEGSEAEGLMVAGIGKPELDWQDIHMKL